MLFSVGLLFEQLQAWQCVLVPPALHFFETDIVINDKRQKFVSERNRLRESKEKHANGRARGVALMYNHANKHHSYTTILHSSVIDYSIILLSGVWVIVECRVSRLGGRGRGFEVEVEVKKSRSRLKSRGRG